MNCKKFDLAKIKNINEILNCIKDNSLSGSKSTTGSASDIYRFLFKDGTKYKNQPLEAGFMKVYISNNDEQLKNKGINPTVINLIEALIYEKMIYDIIKNEILLKGKNPHFIKYLGGIEDISYDDMINFLKSKSGLDIVDLEKNFTRNINYMVNDLENRPSITDNIKGNLSVKLKNPKDFKYGFMLLENIEIPNKVIKNIDELQTGQSLQLFQILPLLKDNDLSITKIYFQIATALLALYDLNIVHNDLHTGNVFVRKINPTKFKYNINGKKYVIESEFEALLFDFDRAYIKGFDNPYLDNYLERYGQFNNLSDKRDILKVYQFYYQHFPDNAEKIFNIIFKDNSIEIKYNLKKLQNDTFEWFNGKYEKIVKSLEDILKGLYIYIQNEEINVLKNFCLDLDYEKYKKIPVYIQKLLRDEANLQISTGFINQKIYQILSM